MGKKRKGDGRPFGDPRPANGDDNSKIRVTTFEDVADSEDEFHLNQDKILLDEGPAAKRLRKWKEQDAFLQPSDEEVLDYSDADEDDQGEDEELEDAGDYEDDDGKTVDAGKHDERADDEEEDVGGWGPSKQDYYDADVIETEQDALDEEKEARRIQQKQLQAMTEADFGFDEEEWTRQDGTKAEDSSKVVVEVLPQLQITEDMPESEKLKILRSRYPEFDHIAREYQRLQPLHDELAAAAKASEHLIKIRRASSDKPHGILVSTPIAITKYRACASYLAAMAMYFAILGSTANEDGASAVALAPSELHEHAVMESLLKCQKLWQRMESLPVADPMVLTSNGDEISVIEEETETVPSTLLDEAIARKRKEKRQKKSKAQLAAETAQAEAGERRAAKLLRTEQELAALASLTDKSALRKISKAKKTQQPMLNLLNAEDSDFGEETTLNAHELAEKARKKKSLRFYTSQIAQKINKRDAAGKDYGGDADVPHRERLKDRQARLQAEAERRGQNKDKGPGVALGEGGESSDEDDAATRGTAGEEDDYYDMVSARSKAKKQAKTDLAAAYALAQKEGGRVVPQETVGADGKRQITYQILKNKGMTPHRKKEVRNPRVKKKLKYAEKKKKLKSTRAVYGGGEGRGGYGGELTGIKKGLVRSTKL